MEHHHLKSSKAQTAKHQKGRIKSILKFPGNPLINAVVGKMKRKV